MEPAGQGGCRSTPVPSGLERLECLKWPSQDREWQAGHPVGEGVNDFDLGLTEMGVEGGEETDWSATDDSNVIYLCHRNPLLCSE